MGHNTDGSATCDRCGIWLAGFGVRYGLVCTDTNLTTGAVRDWIFCYTNQCRAVVLTGFVNYPQNIGTVPTRCTDDDTKLDDRIVGTAMLACDMHPNDPGVVRYLQFCYETGSRDRFLTHLEATR